MSPARDSVGAGTADVRDTGPVTATRRPATRYVTVDGAQVAYQVVGDGPVDLVYFYGVGSHIELFWDEPSYVELLERLASFSRLILFDRRGTGSSDRVEGEVPTWEQSADDIAAVLDAVGSERAAIVGDVDAGPIAVLFAATRPERVRALVLSNSSARFLWAEDYPIGATQAMFDAGMDSIEALWGTEELFALTCPGRLAEPGWAETMARQNRAALTPRAAGALLRCLLSTLDVRAALPLVQAPTLVLHNTGNRQVPVAHGRYLAERIPGARLVELESEDLTWSLSTITATVEAIGELVTGAHVAAGSDRILATVLFTDIVGSTERAVAVGDERWRALLDVHDQLAREQLRRFGGREVKTTGDGFVAVFDGPSRAIRCAEAVAAGADALGLAVRSGIHTGECEVRGEDVGGVAVHIAARLADMAGSGEVLVSRTTRDLAVGSKIEFDDRGTHTLKGVPEPWQVFAARC